MFKLINKMSVKSTNGYRLISQHRFYYHYIEGKRVMKVNVHDYFNSDGQFCADVTLDSLNHWLPPHDQETITPEKKRKIKENIAAALAYMNCKCRFVI